MEATETTTEQSLEQQLEALFTESAAPAAGSEAEPKPASDTQQPAATSPPAVKPEGEKPAETPAPVEEDPLLKALEGIEDGEKPKENEPAKPQLTEEQSKVLEAIPSIEAATKLYEVAQNHANFASALEQGRHADVVKMFETWNKPAFESFLEHIYEKKVESGEWVNRFIDEQEHGKRANTQVRQLQRQIDEMRSQLSQRSQSEQQSQIQQQQQQTFIAYNQHVNGLFEKINFNEADRPWIMARLNTAVAADPKLLNALKSGNVNAVNGLFKETVKTYVTRDKQASAAVKAKIDEQSQRRPLLGGSAAQEQQALPDDIRQVPKGQEDNWMDQQFAKLKRFVKS